MAACPGGARPKPGQTSATILLRMGSGLTDVLTHITSLWPNMLNQAVWGRVDVATLCNGNPDDPGPPTAEDLAYTAILVAQATEGSLGGAYGSWAWKQLVYQNFLNSCECINPVEIPPPRQPVPPPTGEPVFPSDHNDQDPLTRIEDNQGASMDALRVLYNGLMEVNAQTSDLTAYIRPNYVGTGGTGSFLISGEGQRTLIGHTPSDGSSVPDLAGVRVHLNTLPTVYKVRGTLVPRYYGVGSLMWITSDAPSGVSVVTHRESIHYINQWMPKPPSAMAYQLAWRLMPGAQATVYQVRRTIPGAMYPNEGWSQDSLVVMSQDTPPSGWSDPPFYPIPAAAPPRMFALGGVP